MGIGILFIVVAIIIIVLHFKVRNHSKNNRREVFKGSGTIDDITHTESGGANYYVNFIHEGQVVHGKTETYPSVAKSKHKGDQVDFDYFIISSGSPSKLTGSTRVRARIRIHDEDYTPLKDWEPCNAALYFGLFVLAFGIFATIVFR